MTLPTPPPVEKAGRPGDIPVGAIVAWIVRRRVALAIGAGVLFRVVGFLWGRPLGWMRARWPATSGR